MSDPAQFFPDEGPDALDSQQWIDDYNQVMTLGAFNSTVRTQQQTEIGLFWTQHTGQQYAHAFRNLDTQKGLDTPDTARLMAMRQAMRHRQADGPLSRQPATHPSRTPG